MLHCSLLLVALQTPSPAAPAAAPAAAPDAAAADEPRGLRLAESGAAAGYTLFAPISSHHTYLVDLTGKPVQRWTSELAPSSVYLLDDGSILRAGQLQGNKVFSGGGQCGRVERIAWDGKLVWKYELSNEDQMEHHDALPLPNGNVLLICWEFRYREDLLAAGRDPAHVNDKGLWPDALLEVKPTLPEGGEIVWEWHVWDHLVQDLDPKAANFGVVSEHSELIDLNFDTRKEAPVSAEEKQRQDELAAQMRATGYAGGEEDDAGAAKPAAPAGPGNGADWLHMNGISYDAKLDLIAVSSPHLSEVWILDHSTSSAQAAAHKGGRYGKGGDLLWRWGNPKHYGAGGDEDRKLFYQHNVQWIAAGLSGAGHLLVFNNGQERPGGEYSSVLELALPFEPGKGFTRAGAAFGPAEPSWSYSAPVKESFYAPFISGCQRLANGDTLICVGPKGRIFEVTSAGAIVWEYWNPYGGDVKNGGGGVEEHALFRATHIAPDHPGLKGKKLAPIELEPAK